MTIPYGLSRNCFDEHLRKLFKKLCADQVQDNQILRKEILERNRELAIKKIDMELEHERKTNNSLKRIELLKAQKDRIEDDPDWGYRGLSTYSDASGRNGWVSGSTIARLIDNMLIQTYTPATGYVFERYPRDEKVKHAMFERCRLIPIDKISIQYCDIDYFDV